MLFVTTFQYLYFLWLKQGKDFLFIVFSFENLYYLRIVPSLLEWVIGAHFTVCSTEMICQMILSCKMFAIVVNLHQLLKF